MNYTALVTGSTSGIGKATALALAFKGWKVIIHGRNSELCKLVVAEIIDKTGNLQVEYIVSDLSNLDSVISISKEITDRFPELNILINNAGTFSNLRKLTKQGFEITWTVNYLSRFLLTNLLLDLLKQNTPARIVDVSGMYYAKGNLNFSDISLRENYSMSKANNQSKLANVLFTYYLARRLKGTGVSINTLHPGAVNTGSVLKAEGFSKTAKLLYKLVSVFFKSPKKGAETTIFLASSPSVEGISGKYFIGNEAVKSSDLSYDQGLQKELWNYSQKELEKINLFVSP